MRIAKASNEDLESVRDFFSSCELALEKEKFSWLEPERNWTKLDDDDEEKEIIIRIKKRLSKELNILDHELDDRIVMYEYLQKKFKQVSCGWRRVHIAAEVLIEETCDPTEDHLSFDQSITFQHVSNEQ